ncbi:unnamed protein product [Closterium sp. NIES-53]
MSRLTLWMAFVAALLILGCAVTEANHASKPASSSELSESLPNRRMLSPTSRRLLSRDGGGFSDSEMEAMHDSMWRWRNSMDRSRRRGGRGGGMMGGRGKAEKENAEKEAFPEGDCGGNGGGESQEAPHLELIRRSMRAVGLITGISGDSASAAATSTNGGRSNTLRFGGRRMSFPLMHMHHGRMHVPMMGMGMGNMNEHPMHFRADNEPPEVAPLRSSTPCAFFSSICNFFRRVFGASSPSTELPSNEDTVVGSSGIGAHYPRRMMRGRATLGTVSMSTFGLVNGLVMENDQEHAMTDVPGMDEMMGDRDGMMKEGDDMMMEGGDMMMQGDSITTDNEKVMMPTGDGTAGRQMDDKDMEDMMEGMMGENRMMLRGGNA